MAATLIGASGLAFGLTAEAGGIAQNFRNRESVQTAEVNDEDGDITGAAFYGPTGEISGELVFTGATGVVSAALGAQVSFANFTGVTGTVRLTERETSLSNTGFKTVNVTAKNYPSIAATT
jgi:hypothetical protein